jgi:hypothetical protein
VGLDYRIDRHWFIDARASILSLRGDARDSPITSRATPHTIGLFGGYRFDAARRVDDPVATQRGALLVFSSSSSSPTGIAHRLGYLALAPFVVGAVLVWPATGAWHAATALALSAYAAVVLSFIGALHWGMAFARPTPTARPFVWGVIPSLVAWVAVLTPLRAGLCIHAVMLAICYLVDRATYPALGAAAWLPLRLRLTIVATASCLVGAAGS